MWDGGNREIRGERESPKTGVGPRKGSRLRLKVKEDSKDIYYNS